MRRDHHAPARPGRAACLGSRAADAAPRHPVHRRDPLRAAAEQAGGQRRRIPATHHARAEQNRVASGRTAREPHGLGRSDLTVRGLVQAGNARLGHRERHAGRDVANGRDLQLARAGAQRRDPREQHGARHLHPATDDEDAAARILVRPSA
jgi:hypothetical protein